MLDCKKAKFIIMLVFITGLFVFALSGCKSTASGDVSELNYISNPSENYEIHCSREDNLTSHPVLSSGFIELLIDTENCSFSIKQTDDKSFYWSALPVLESGKYSDSSTSDADVLSINVLSGTDIYALNSQDNSVSYNTAFYDLIDNGVVFTYNIYKDKETAQKKSLTQNDIAFSVKLSITLVDGSMFADCTYSNLSGNKNAVITKINLLKWFGAYNISGENDFLLVPDGCGAIIKTNVNDETFKELSFPVYGNDPALGENDSGMNVVIPSFGIKRAEHAFVAIISEADAIATIKANKALSSDEYNIVYPEFNISPYLLKNGKLYLSGSNYSYNENIKMCYRFVSGNNANYSGLASACREQLIRDSVLSSRNVSESDSLPFNLSVIATQTKKIANKITFTITSTSTEQATDMVTRMKNKGINNINIRYRGIFEGGIHQNNITSASLLMRVGTNKQFESFFNYIDTQNMKLYFDINLLTANKGLRINNQALSIQSKKLNNEYHKYRSMENMSNLAKKTLLNTKNYLFSGYCINDSGSLLYSDYSSGGCNRSESKSIISQTISPLATNNFTMINGGNFYTLKNADIVVSLPISTSIPESGAYESIPFVQSILHGVMDYSGAPLNFASDIGEARLKYIEYGACPYYEWSYNNTPENEAYYYDDFINSASEFYKQSDSVLSDLREYRIVNHSMVTDGIYLTEYENGTMIYVNYTDKDYTISGIQVSAGSFERVN